jgi:DNA polymerase III subunit delta
VTAVSARDVDAFIARPDPRKPVVLVFGPDLGLVRERAQALLKGAGADSADPFSTVVLDGDALAADPGRLADEARAIGLFGGKRLVHVRAGGRSFVEPLEALLADPPQNAFIVIEAGDLKKGAPLRKLAESSSAAAALPCYEDDERSIAQLIDATLRNAGMTIDKEARETLVGLLGSDRMATRAELEKLVLYAGDKKRIEYDDVLAAIADSSALALDDVVDAAAAGDPVEVVAAFAHARGEGIPASVVLGAAIRHVATLHRLSLRVERGERPGNLVREPQQRIHFRRQPMFERALSRFSPRDLEHALTSLGAAMLASRRTAGLADPITEREMLRLAAGGRRRR